MSNADKILEKMRNNPHDWRIESLKEEDGGGFLITFPDFSECISDGETPEEAIRNGLDALHETIMALESAGHSVPKPGSSREKFIQHLPKSLYTRLVVRAKQEGISINAFVTALIVEKIDWKSC